MAVAGDRLMDRYELIEPLGSGGMATVWRATDVRLRRQVAVKILRPEYAEDEAFVRRLEVEARHAASLQHANVATVFDTGSDGDTHFIVMELADGPTVADLLRHRGFLVAPLAVEIAAAAARALAAAHRRGLVHRDVKPANLLVARDGTVRLADFGIARALAANRVTVPGIVLGSIPYLSPEQARGDDATPGGDIFSLGVVLFEMLTGRLPWGADSPAALATVRLTTPPLQASTIRTDLPSGLDAIVERALDLEPARRYPSARAFAETLETWRRRFAAAAPGPTPDLAETVAMAALVAQPPGMAAPVAQPPGGPAAMAALVAEPPATAGTDGLAAGRDPRRVVAWAHARLNPAQVVPVPPARVDTVATRRRRGRSAPAAAGTSPAR